MTRKVTIVDIKKPYKNRGQVYEFYSWEPYLSAAKEVTRRLWGYGPLIRRVPNAILDNKPFPVPIYVVYTRK